MKKIIVTLLALLPLAAAYADEGLNYNFNKSQDPIAKQVWVEDHAGREKPGLSFCNVPGEYDCNLKMHGFRTCGNNLRWEKWKWIGEKEKSESALSYQFNCVRKK